MMNSSLQELIDKVRAQNFPHKDELMDAVAAGRGSLRTSHVEGGTTADASELLGTYRVRHAHLSGMRSAHAQAMAGDVEWFCGRLEAAPRARVAGWSVGIGHPYSLQLFLDAETGEVLGCMKTVSQLDATPEEWERLWSEA